ncbi:diguanylate cyclase [Pseudomonas sp. BN414]|uniref:diguanylate cyclase n=1 Tax=Pseudomonas sp. BN414 TaxID=2567888 RepID=UPI0024566C28|nr:diguanylate cyclase [Pseudomonas sp. BN414]MDH4569504.1 diguanylate cyclase [Pseudomonas sp. BN414]
MQSLATEKLNLSALLSGRPLVWLVCLLAIFGGAALTLLLSKAVRSAEEAQLRERFSLAATERISRIQERLDGQLKELDAVQRFFGNSHEVTLSEFQGFVGPLLGDTLVYSWVPRVTGSERERFESRGREEGMAGFAIRDLKGDGLVPSPPRNEYFPVYYSVTSRIDQVPLGMDLNSSPQRRAAIAKARKTHGVTVTERVRVMGAVEREASGVVMLAPVYDDNLPKDSGLRGFVVSVLSLNLEMEAAIAPDNLANLSMRVSDVSEDGHEQLIYQSAEVPESDLRLRRVVPFGDRQYLLEVVPSAAFLEGPPLSTAKLVAISGLAFTFLLAGYLLLMVNQRQNALALVAQRTMELREREIELQLSEERWSFALDGAGHGVWDWEPQSGRVFLSRGWKSMLGYTEEDVGDSLEARARLIHPQDQPQARAELERHLRGASTVYQSQHRMLHKDGRWLWVLDRGRVVDRDATGMPLRMIGTQTDISSSKAVELQLAMAHGQLRSLLNAATQVAIISTDLRGAILQFNVGAERMFGYRALEMIGRHPVALHVESEVEARCRELGQQLGKLIPDYQAYVEEVTAGDRYDEHEWTFQRRDGSQLTCSLILTGVRDERDVLVGYLGVAIDVTERKHVQQALEARDRLLEKLSARVPGVLYQFRMEPDEHFSFPYTSAGILEVFEVESEKVRDDATWLLERIHPDDVDRVQTSIRRSAEALAPWREDFRVLLPRQGLRWLRGESVPERGEDGAFLWHGYITDITGLKLVEQELRALSVTDALTGVYNRRYFQERLDLEIARAERREGPLALVMLDVDHFKQINDCHGHEAGDRVLKTLCQRVGERLRRIDVLCRLGGEEFVVLCPDTNVDQAFQVAQALWQALSREHVAGVGSVTASFGCAGWREGESADDLLRRVDAAVYAAKQAGRNRIQIAD